MSVIVFKTFYATASALEVWDTAHLSPEILIKA